MAVTFPTPATNNQIVSDTSSGMRWQYNAALNSWLKIPSVSQKFYETFVVASTGQTAFTLASAPTNLASVTVFVNGVAYFAPDVSVTGTALTWVSSILLEASDTVRVTYE